ncbi:MAG: radical SAM protein [Syntrophales bacterium]
MLLIHPPVVRPCEPPPGLAVLAGSLKAHDAAFEILEANVEGIHHFLKTVGSMPVPAGRDGNRPDTWTRRAHHHHSNNLSLLTSPSGYTNINRYGRAVGDIQRLLEKCQCEAGAHLGLANFTDDRLSPVRSSDLAICAENPQNNPFYPYFQSRLTQLIENKQPTSVGISLNYLSQVLCTFAMIGFLKIRYPSMHIILGGGLATSWMRQPGWRNLFSGLIDTWFAGPAEAQLIRHLGFEWCGGRQPPLYDRFLPDQADYFSPGFILPYSASSGCYWGNCSFCPERAEENPYRPLPAEDVVHELRELTDRTQPVLIHLIDNALSPVHLRALAKNPPGAPWYGFVRITDALTDRGFCIELRQSGCVMLQLGLESGDQDVLDALNKGVDLVMAAKALRAIKAAGIASYIYLLFGTPPETLAAAQKTLRFVVQHSDQIRFLNLAIFNLPAFGPDTDSLDTEEFYDGDLVLYRNFRHPCGWNRQNVRRFLDREFRRHQAVTPILRRDPPVFTSNHAPFFV